MARTAPAPNIPAIPGMNPGALVMGGGGAGGGGSGKGAGAGGAGQGAGGGSGGEGAEGGGGEAPAGAEGQASQACPVDVVTGVVYTLPITDFSLPGPLPLAWVRSYRSSAVVRNVGIGWGWTHTFAWHARLKYGRISVYDADGVATRFGRLAVGERKLAPHGRSLRRARDELILEVERGPTRVLRKAEGDLFRLAEVRDDNGNVIRVEWDGPEIVALVDSAGRRIERLRTGAEIRWVASAADAQGRLERRALITYVLDERGDLAKTIDALGFATEYAYDDDHLLTRERRPDGLSYHYRYGPPGDNGRGRCLETWGAIEGIDILTELGGPRAPGVRGVFHTRFEYGPEPYESTVIDATGAVQRYRGNALGLVELHADARGYVTTMRYDDRGKVVCAADADGNTELWSYDDEGRCTSYTDALGRATMMERGERGRITEIIDAIGGSWTMRYDERGNLVERTDPERATTTCSYDERGLLSSVAGPTGSADTLVRDAHGNVVEFRSGAGAVWRYSYDAFGQVTGVTGPDGARWSFACDARGDVVLIEGPQGIRIERTFDSMRRIVREVHPQGAVSTWRFVGDALVERTFADGSRVRTGYDALLRVLWIENAAGERMQNELDLDGYVVRQRDFAGIETRITRDHLGRAVQVERSDAGVVVIERDAVGCTRRLEMPDGSQETYAYDPLGFVVEAVRGEVAVRFERDGRGRIQREECAVGDRRFAVAAERDPAGRVTRVRYSTGWGIAYAYGGASRPTRVAVERDRAGGSCALTIARDPLGRAVGLRRERPDHAVEVERDELGRVTRARVIDGHSERAVRSYRWSNHGVVESIHDAELGERRFDVDLAGRPLAVEGLGTSERFRYSPQGTPLPEAEEWEIGRGGRILHLGATRFGWDDLGRLVRREPTGPRLVRAGERIETSDAGLGWSYRYDDKDQLVEARRDDGFVVRSLYDAFGRRVAEASSDGALRWFGWDGDRCVEERRSDGTARLQVFGDDGVSPWLDATDEAGWRLCASDQAGTPWFYLGGDGSTARLDLTAWGRDARVEGDVGSLRLAGQRRDEATGLSYQYHRYYAPDLALFLTPDPLGIDGSLHDVGFVPNVTAWIDPLGLAVVLMSDDPALMGVAQARAAATGQKMIHHSALAPGSLAGESHVEVVTHGAPGEAQLGNKMVRGRDIGDKLNQAGFSGDSIHMTTCNAGTRPYLGLGTSVAQEVANTTGADVTAADAGWRRRHEGALVWTHTGGPNAGQQYIAGGVTDSNGKFVTSQAWGSGGRWRTYTPRF